MEGIGKPVKKEINNSDSSDKIFDNFNQEKLQFYNDVRDFSNQISFKKKSTDEIANHPVLLRVKEILQKDIKSEEDCYLLAIFNQNTPLFVDNKKSKDEGFPRLENNSFSKENLEFNASARDFFSSVFLGKISANEISNHPVVSRVKNILSFFKSPNNSDKHTGIVLKAGKKLLTFCDVKINPEDYSLLETFIDSYLSLCDEHVSSAGFKEEKFSSSNKVLYELVLKDLFEKSGYDVLPVNSLSIMSKMANSYGLAPFLNPEDDFFPSDKLDYLRRASNDEKVHILRYLNNYIFKYYKNKNNAKDYFESMINRHSITMLEMAIKAQCVNRRPCISIIARRYLDNFESHINTKENNKKEKSFWGNFSRAKNKEELNVPDVKNEEISPEEYNLSPIITGAIYRKISSDAIAAIDKITSLPIILYKQDSIRGDFFSVTKYQDLEVFGIKNNEISSILKSFHDPEIMSTINNSLNLKIENLDLSEQSYLLKYLLDSNESQFNKLKNVLNRSPENNSFFKSFLSIHHGGIEMGDKVIELAEKLPENVAKKVFGKYSEIVDATEEVSQYVFDKVKSEDGSENLPIEQIKETLLKRGKDLLVGFNEQVKTCTEEECFEIGEKILEELIMIKKEVLLFASTFKNLAKEKGTKLGDMQDVTINITKDPEFIKTYQDQMERIFLLNRKNYPEDLKKSSLTDFQEALSDTSQREFYILKEGEDVVAFMRFDELPNGNLYAGSLNSRSEIKGMAVGGAMLREVLGEKAKTRNIEAMVFEKNPMFDRYISDEYKFEIVGEIEDYNETGQKMYKLLRRSEVLSPENLPV